MVGFATKAYRAAGPVLSGKRRREPVELNAFQLYGGLQAISVLPYSASGTIEPYIYSVRSTVVSQQFNLTPLKPTGSERTGVCVLL